MFTLQETIEATEQGLRTVYQDNPEERDMNLANRVLVLAWFVYDTDRTGGRAAYHLALALGAVGKNQESIHFFEQAISTEPTKADYHGDYAATLLWLHRQGDARRQIEKAKALDQHNGQFDCVEGRIEEKLKNYSRALECYQRGQQKLAKYPEANAEHRRSLRVVGDDIERLRLEHRQIHGIGWGIII